jgi:hypothetical protein
MVLDIAGHTLDSATSLNLSPTNQLFTDYVDPLYKKDYWKFQLSSSSNFNLTLNGLSQDVNVELLDANGIVIKGSYNTGILAETINQNLNPGNYYLAVNLNSNTTDSSYNLNLSAYVSPVTAIESAGNTKLVKDESNKYFTQVGTNAPTAIKNGGQQISQNIYGSDWQTIAAETVTGNNQVLWKNVSGNYLHIWHLDNNWNWVSSEGAWALNSSEAWGKESVFGIDANSDGVIGTPYISIESVGNTKLIKDVANKYFTQIGTNTPTAIKNGGQQIYQDIYSGWQTLAAETVNGDNQVLWKNTDGNFLHIWHLDSNWNWVSSEGQWALNSPEALTQETKFGIDANGDGYIPVELAGNTKLIKDVANKYFTQIGTNTPTAIKNGGQQIYQDIYSGWQTLAAETVNGDNQVLWKNTDGNFLHIWHLDSNWNWVSSEGQWALNSPEALTQETKFGIDANGDGYIPVELAGNTKLIKDVANKYFTQIGTNTPTAIKNGGQQIYQDIYSGWQTLAAETVNGDNQVLWKNTDGNFLHIWHLDSNWNWVSSEGQWALNSPEALTQETKFGIDANGDGYIPVELAGNTKLIKDVANKYFTQIGTNTPTAIKNGGQQIYQDIYSGWQTLAAETVNGDNQVLWKNTDGNFLHIWHLDSNWNWVSSEGQWALNSPEALTQETKFGIDANGDGYIPVELAGNTKLIKDVANKYFTQIGTNTPTAIKNGGQQIYQDIYGSAWQTIAAETVNGDNQVLWKNVAGNYLHIWHLDNNWNWVSSEGQWAFNSPEALTQEIKFGIDANGDGYIPVELAGNTKLIKDATKKYFTQIGTNTPTAIKNGGQQIYQDIYSGWQTLAAETVNGDNQVLWKNTDGNFLHIWHLDSNWNWVSSEGQWALNSSEALTQETKFGIDANGDGVIGYNNTLNTARNIVIGSSPIYDSVSNLDLNNFYRFTASQSGIFTANLTGLTGDADVRLIQDKNNNGVIDTAQLYNSTTGTIDTGEILAWQWERGTGNEAIRSFLNPGTYYLQVMSYNNQIANYNLATNFTPAASDDRKFSIQINVDSSMNATAQAIIRKAADFWEKAISYSSFNGSQILTINVSKDSSLTNWGGYATGQITGLDANGRYTGEVYLSPAVVNDLNIVSNSERNPGLYPSLLVHEIGHILGLVGFAKNTVDRSTGTYNANTYAGWVYGELKGTFIQTAIPLMTGMGPGSDYAHWNQAVFGNEIMVYIPGSTSQLSLAALRDVGWNINYGVAQPYSLPALGGTGNTLTTAVTDFGTVAAGSSWTWKDNYIVYSPVPDRFYKFKFDGIGTLNVTLDNLTADANMRLIYDANSNGIIDAGEVIATSTNTGTTSESFNFSNLAAGTYYVDVYATNYLDSFGNRFHINTSYNLNFNNLTASAPPIGNNLTTVTYDFGNLSPGWYAAWNASVGFVGDSRIDDLFRFNFAGTTNLTFNLTELTDNADMRLIYDSNNNGLIDPGEVIATSTNLGNLSETITLSGLLAGNYYLYVYRFASTVNTRYRLQLENLVIT